MLGKHHLATSPTKDCQFPWAADVMGEIKLLYVTSNFVNISGQEMIFINIQSFILNH
jgi:hypothetical protein